VTKLIIYRGEARHSEVPLTGKTMTIGRSADNDVVLEDPGKGVSRAHAELRAEGNKYRLVDLNSQNGIWVSGARVPSVLLTPGVVAAMGPYRVAIDAASPLTQPFTPVKEPFPDTGTELLSRASLTPAEAPVPPVAPSPAPVAVVDGPGALLDNTAPEPTPAGAAPPPKPPPPSTATPPAKPAAKPSGTATVRNPSAASSGSAKALVGLVVAILLIAASGFGAYKFVEHRRAARPVWDATLATNLVNSGKCQEALDTQINRALQANANDAQALSLKQKCATPPPPPPLPQVDVPPVKDPKVANTEKLDSAESSIAANSCQAALDLINEVLAQEPTDERATALAAKANACLNPAPATTTAARANPPAEPAKPQPVDGIEVKPGETRTVYTARVTAVRKQYDDAVTQLQDQHFTEAIKTFDALLAQAPGYKDAAQQRAAAQNGLRNEATRAYQSGQAAEQRQEWNAAIQGYQRARALDASRDVSADVARVVDLKAKAGQAACANGDAAFTLSHNSDAATSYQKVLELLPTSDPCYARAKQRLQIIR
jgi:predicted component of type VI protein secretion system